LAKEKDAKDSCISIVVIDFYGGQLIFDLFPVEHDAPGSADDGFTSEPTPCFRHPDAAGGMEPDGRKRVYLKQNALPKYLVIQLAPETFYQPHGLETLSAFDPIMLMMRHDPGYATTKKLLQNPLPTLRFLSIVLQARYRPNRAYGASFMELYRGPIADYYAHSGFLTMPKGPEGGCGEPKPLGAPADFGWIDEARKRYSAQGVKVLVLVSPTPECDPQKAIYRELDAHVDGVSTTLPLELFNDGDRHYTREGSAVVSEMVAQKILALEAH
jgi:hypothetical protein